MLKDMLRSVPAKPAIILAPIIIVVVMGIYYLEKKASCNKQASLRDGLKQEATKLDSTSILKLADWTDFAWDRVTIFNDFRPKGKLPSCLFDWDWSDSERREIIDQGFMTVLLFANEGRLSEYIELRGDQFNVIVEEGRVLTPDDALFRLKKEPGTGTGLSLSLAVAE